ncbi:MAG: hypothetical protein KME23_04435 [Goleter apudmare HA4340-LM2]|nr:hypothetical protein [Goleter apudmare HA4340-LM2]
MITLILLGRFLENRARGKTSQARHVKVIRDGMAIAQEPISLHQTTFGVENGNSDPWISINCTYSAFFSANQHH